MIQSRQLQVLYSFALSSRENRKLRLSFVGASFAGYLQATTPGGTLYFLGNFFDSAGLPALTQNASKALFPVGIDQNATFGRILSVLSSGPGDFGQNSTQVGVDNAAVVSVLGDGQQNPVWLIGNNGNVSIYYDNGKGSQNQAAMCTVVDPSTQTAHLRITNTVALPSTAKCDGGKLDFFFFSRFAGY